jgi:hypothetical protein
MDILQRLVGADPSELHVELKQAKYLIRENDGNGTLLNC